MCTCIYAHGSTSTPGFAFKIKFVCEVHYVEDDLHCSLIRMAWRALHCKITDSFSVPVGCLQMQVMQTEQDTWSVLTWALSNPDEAMRPATEEELDDCDPGGDIDERFAPREIGPMSQV